MRPSCILLTALCAAVPAVAAQTVTRTPVTVEAIADLYFAYGVSGNPWEAQAVDVVGKKSVTVKVTGGSISFNGGANYNDADGIGSASDIIASNADGLSGVFAPNAGFLAGVFISASQNPIPPGRLNFFPDHLGTDFTRLAPKLQQTFFIGDGLTGDGTGTRQTFVVPAGATALVVGFIDACDYRGKPNMSICYADNLGSFTAVVSTHAPAPTDGTAPQDEPDGN